MKTRSEKNKKIQKEITREESQKKIKKIVKGITIFLIFTLSILCYGMFIGAKVVVVNEYKITNSLIPNSFHGMKIVHFSDLLFNSLNQQDLNKIKEKINDLEADILIFTGDIKKQEYVLNKKEIQSLEDFFKGLESTTKKYAVIGDNDDESFSVIMENSNFQVLNNQSETIYYKDTTPIKIIGMDSANMNLDSIPRDENYSICLLHNPDKIKTVLEKVNCHLALAGDTLGGEIKIPFYKGILDNHTYYKKYYKIKDTDLYISNGLGNNSNIRLFNHPSIGLYRLTKY